MKRAQGPSGRDDVRAIPPDELPRFGKKNWREIDLKRLGIAGAVRLSIVRIDSVLSRLKPHCHPGCVEIILCLRGENLKCIHKGREDVLRPGEAFVAFPDERHCILEEPKGRFTYSLLFRMKDAKGLFGFTSQEAKGLLKRIRGAGRPIVAVPQSLQGVFQAIFKAHDNQDMDRLERKMRIRHLLDSILFALVESCEKGVRATVVRDVEIRTIADQMTERPLCNYPLEQVCRRIGVSKTGFIARFKRVTGLPPHAYLLKCRVDLAKKKLQEGRKLASVAHELGFSSLPHFTKVFREIAGVPPTQWRAY